MTSHPIRVSFATATFGLYKYRDERGLWFVSAELPGADLHYREGWCDLRDADEHATWSNDFHGESKSWRSLMDCIASDWASTTFLTTRPRVTD